MVVWILGLMVKWARHQEKVAATAANKTNNKKEPRKMAGRIESGDPAPKDTASEPETEEEEEWSGPDAALGVPLHIQTDAFSATAIPLYGMPGNIVLDVIEAEGQKQIAKMFRLFKMAITDPSKVPSLEVLSFTELTEVIAQWVEKSAPSDGSF